MPKSVFDGYLTPACATCKDWSDGSDGRGYGCATSQPISYCPHFAAMEAEENKKLRVCKNCKSYSKEEKICKITGDHVPKRHTCDNFTINF